MPPGPPDIDRWIAATIFAPLEAAHDPASAITSMIGEAAAYFRSGGRVCLIGWIGLGTSGDAFAARVTAYFARWIAALAHCLEAGGVPSPLAAQLAEETVCAIQGAIVLARALGDEIVFMRIVRRQEAALLDSLVRRGR